MRSLLLILTLVALVVAAPSAQVEYRFHTDMNYPTDVAVLLDGRICVADGVNGRVLVFRKSGKYKELRFPEMKRPLGLAPDWNGGLIITDTQSDIILFLNKRLKLKSFIQLPPEVDATDIQPIGKKILWVVDNDGHRIIVMDRQGNIENKVGHKGKTGPTFNYPATIAQDGKGQLYITDVLNGRIQVFSEDGSYMGQVSKWGITPGSIYRPKGVAADGSGTLAISDSFTGTIHFYKSQSSEGQVLTTREKEPLHLENPLGVAWGRDGLLWVVESGSGDLLGVRLH